MNKKFRRSLWFSIFSLLAACPGKHYPDLIGSMQGMTPVAGGQLTVTDPNGQTASIVTAADGSYKLDIADMEGSLTACVSGGTLIELATGTIVQLGSAQLCTVAVDVKPGAEVRANITFPAHLAYAHAQFLVGRDHRVLGDAFVTASADLNAVLGCASGADLVRAAPLNPTLPVDKAVEMTPSVQGGLLWGGISFQAKAIAEAQGSTPGVRIHTLALVQALADDLRGDGIFNGRGVGGPIRLGDHLLDADSVRAGTLGLVQGLRAFLASEYNSTHLTFADVRDTVSCMSHAHGALFRGDRLGELDETGPEITITTPVGGTVIAGTAALSCTAQDVSGVKSMRWEGRAGQQAIAGQLFKGADFVSLDGETGRLTAELDVATFAQGPLTIACVAEDRVSNSAEETVEVMVVNQDPLVAVVRPAADSTVKGEVVIECQCEHALGASCELSAPTTNVVPSDREGGAPGVRRYLWNTEAELDGHRAVQCAASVGGLPAVQSKSVPVTLDNWPNGKASGVVYADSPIRDVLVQAFSYADGTATRELGRTESKNGRFEVVLPDDYRGPVLFVASRTKSAGVTTAYRSAIFENRDVALMDGRLTLLWDLYTPGDSVTGLSINIATSLAEALATTQVRDPRHAPADGALAALSENAHYLIAQHLRQGPTIDVRHTPVRDLTSPSDPETNEEPTLMGLFHVGLSRLGAETARDEGSSAESLPSLVVLDRLRRDLSDGVFDGLDDSGVRIAMTPRGIYKLSADTLRWDLAAAIRRWLNNEGLTSDHQGSNRSGLAAAHYAMPGGMLRNLAGNNSDLFDRAHAPRVFDVEGPVIAVELQDAEGHPWGNRPARGKVFVAVRATDDSSVASTWARIAGENLHNQYPVHAPQYDVKARFKLDTGTIGDGTYDLEVGAKDTVTNPSVVKLSIVIDNTEPTIHLESFNKWVKGDVDNPSISAPIRLKGKASKGFESLSVTAPGSSPLNQHPLVSGGKEFDVTYTVPCNRRSTIRLQVEDAAGNLGVEDVEVLCDNSKPRLAWSDSKFHSELRSFEVSFDEKGSSTGYRMFDVLDPLTVQNPPISIEKYVTRLDYLPQHGRDVEANNLPVLVFTVDDSATSGSDGVFAASGELTVEYNYVLDGVIKRPWTRLPAQVEYRLPIAYQTLSADLAAPSKDSVHVVTVRTTDPAGNSSEEAFPFRMHAIVPAVALSGCRLSDSLLRQNMGTLNAFYNSPSEDALDASITWPVDLPPESMTPVMDLEVKMSNSMVSRINAIDALATGEWVNEDWPNDCMVPSQRHKFRYDGDAGCTDGNPPGWERSWTRGEGCHGAFRSGWNCNQPDTDHVALWHAKRPNGAQATNVSALDVGIGNQVAVTSAVFAPRLVVNGQHINGAPFSPDGSFRTVLVDQRSGRDIRMYEGPPRFRQQVRHFTTNRFLRSVSIDVHTPSVEAVHPIYGTVTVQRVGTCAAGSTFTHTFQ